MRDITDLVKKMIEESKRKIDREIKEAAEKGYNVLATKTITDYGIMEGGTRVKQKVNCIPFESMEEAENVLKGKGYSFFDLDLVREHMEREKAEREGKRWNMLKGEREYNKAIE